LNLFRQKNLWKLALLLFSVMIGTVSLIYTETLVRRLKVEERKNVALWAEATRLISLPEMTQNIEFLYSIIENNTTIPVILADEADSIISAGNFNSDRIDDRGFLRKNLNKMKENNDPIVVELPGGHYNLIYYKDSIILTMLKYYPYVQLSVIILFILVSWLAFSSSRKAEQNQVWVGMSKETAHQLGTPTSSLAGWIEIMQHRYPDISITKELSRDVERLEKVTERFSRIGSKPALLNDNITDIVMHTFDYLKSRTSSKVKFTIDFDTSRKIIIPLNTALIEWVIENVAKNAIDSMEGNGIITARITETDAHAFIDIIDTGKGIPKSLFKKIFNPGFTTKQRGWGLGLSLARRIVEEYHHGKIFVRSSEMGKGSCIRIILNK
jgi:signal transduction histidine kinase